MNTRTAISELMNKAHLQFGGSGDCGARIIRPMGAMYESMPLFNAAAGRAAKDAGMYQAAENKKSLLAHARKVAVRLAQHRPITADDVQLELVRQGISIAALGNAAGSLFRGKEWEWTGRYIKSVRVHAHQNELKEWRLK